jgi:actin-like ATPase involved in cell morphogenesis
MDKELSKRLTIKVTRAADPEHCAAKGAGYMLKNMRQLEDHGYYFRSKETIE